MAQKKFRKANSANDGAEWWIADSVADLPINHNPAIKVGDMAVIKPENAVAGDEYDTYMFQYVTGTSGAKHWVLYIDNDTPAAGEVNTASNVGIGEGQSFKAKVGTDLQFRTLKQGANVTIATVGDEVTISAVGPDGGEDNDGANVGTGEGIYRDKTGAIINLKSIKAGPNTTVSSTDDEITISATGPDGGENNYISNKGLGEGTLALPKFPGNPELPIKSIKAGSNISILNTPNEVVVSANIPESEHPVRVETSCNKVYTVTTYMGTDYGVEMTEFIPVTPIQCNHFVTVPVVAGSAVLKAYDILAVIPTGVNTYSLSLDGITYGPSNTNPDLATLTFACSPESYEQVVYLKVINECGETICMVGVTVFVKKPTPVCLNGLVVTLNPNGLVQIQANDLDGGSYDSYLNGPVTLTISKDGINFYNTIWLACQDGEQVQVYLGVTNSCGAFDYCESYILVQDNIGICSEIELITTHVDTIFDAAPIDPILPEAPLPSSVYVPGCDGVNTPFAVNDNVNFGISALGTALVTPSSVLEGFLPEGPGIEYSMSINNGATWSTPVTGVDDTAFTFLCKDRGLRVLWIRVSQDCGTTRYFKTYANVEGQGNCPANIVLSQFTMIGFGEEDDINYNVTISDDDGDSPTFSIANPIEIDRSVREAGDVKLVIKGELPGYPSQIVYYTLPQIFNNPV